MVWLVGIIDYCLIKYCIVRANNNIAQPRLKIESLKRHICGDLQISATFSPLNVHALEVKTLKVSCGIVRLLTFVG